MIYKLFTGYKEHKTRGRGINKKHVRGIYTGFILKRKRERNNFSSGRSAHNSFKVL